MQLRNQSPKLFSGSSRLVWVIVIGCLLTVLIAVLLPASHIVKCHSDSANLNAHSMPHEGFRAEGAEGGGPSVLKSPSTAEEVVAAKLSQFAHYRHRVVKAMARHFKIQIPADVEAFFGAAEAGNWDEIKARFKALSERHDAVPRSHDLDVVWHAILETYGAAEQGHMWPAQKLLDYGNAILGSLHPGMIYVGGTDPGCFIPTFLNDTSDGERHITLTQNALADDTYLNYLSFMYGDRLNTLTQDDRNLAFRNYVADFQKRQAHDQQFPDEPKQLLPGEEIRSADGTLTPYGALSVMAVNESLFQSLLQKNSDASFALEESFPFKSTYASASTLGPIMELRVQGQQDALSQNRVDQSLEYWQQTAQELLSQPDTSEDGAVSRTFSKMATAQANLFRDRNYPAQAEEAFQLATQICPYNPEAVLGYINLLLSQGRFQDAAVVAQNAVQAAPENTQFRALLQALNNKAKTNWVARKPAFEAVDDWCGYLSNCAIGFHCPRESHPDRAWEPAPVT